MATAIERRSERMDLRLTPAEKRLIQVAAGHERLDASGFVLRTVLDRAREVVGRAERLELSERDSLRVLELLDNPPPPTAALVRAARERRR